MPSPREPAVATSRGPTAQILETAWGIDPVNQHYRKLFGDSQEA